MFINGYVHTLNTSIEKSQTEQQLPGLSPSSSVVVVVKSRHNYGLDCRGTKVISKSDSPQESEIEGEGIQPLLLLLRVKQLYFSLCVKLPDTTN